MLTPATTIAALRDQFKWDIPPHYNIGVDICDRPAATTPDAPAIIDVAQDLSSTTYSFADLRQLSNQWANALTAEIKSYVATLLARHEAPREIRYITEMPMTTTGKIIRADLRKIKPH